MPATEICNGADDDCDGEIDEDLGMRSCGNGSCRVKVEACKDGKDVKCTPKQATSQEVCDNNIDDDCDGEIDEGCAGCLPTQEVMRLGRLHQGAVLGAVYNSDRTVFATFSDDGRIHLWDARTRRFLRVLEAHDKTLGVSDVAFGPGGRLLLSGSKDKKLRLWEVGTGRNLMTFGHSEPIVSVAYASTGHMFVSGDDKGFVQRWNRKGPLGAPLQATGVVHSLAMHPGGRLLAVASGSQVTLWDLVTGQKRFTFLEHTGEVRHVVFRADGKFLASASGDKTSKIWEVATGKLYKSFGGAGVSGGHTDEVLRVALSPDGKWLASGSRDRRVLLWELSGTTPKPLDVHKDLVRGLQFVDGSKSLAVVLEDGVFELWDISSLPGKLLDKVSGHNSDVNTVAFHPDGKTIFAGGADDAIRMWALPSGRYKGSLGSSSNGTQHTGDVEELLISPDGTRLFSSSLDKTVKEWSLMQASFSLLRTLMHGDGASGLALAPDGKTLAVGEEPSIYLWDLSSTSTQPRLTLPKPADAQDGHSRRVYSLSISLDGKTLVSGSQDNSLKIWNLPGGTLRKTLRESGSGDVRVVRFSPDGKWLAAGTNDKNVRLWDASKLTVHKMLGHTGAIRSLAFSPDGAMLAVGADDSTITLWEIPSGKRRATISGPAGTVKGLAFSTDGSRLASASEDRLVRLWACACAPAASRSCYPAPAATKGVGTCKAGTQTCGSDGFWGPCIGAVTPKTEIPNNQQDEDCDGTTDEP